VNRNGARNGELMKHPGVIAEQIKAYVKMIETHLFDPDPSTRRDIISPSHRRSPPEGMLHVNVDATLFSPSRQMGLGVVIRNHHNQCLTACSELLEVTTPSDGSSPHGVPGWRRWFRKISGRL
jgi:hypothetical protein